MDNTKLPAYPLPIAHLKEGEIMDTCDYGKGNVGFSKLELASLMIAQGLASNTTPAALNAADHGYYQIAIASRSLAKAVLEEANK